MQIRPRAAIIAAFGVGPLLLAAGCGGTSATGARATIARIQPTSFVEIEPATTTTTTTLPDDFSAPAGTRSPVEQSYTIQSGDSLGAIASRYDITLDQLVNYNQFPGGSGELILPGDVIKIPPDALVPGTATETADPAPDPGTDTGTDTGGEETTADEPATGDGCTHTIVAGENPTKVANQYDITVDELRAANPGGVMDTFLVGATLNIPPNGDCS